MSLCARLRCLFLTMRLADLPSHKLHRHVPWFELISVDLKDSPRKHQEDLPKMKSSTCATTNDSSEDGVRFLSFYKPTDSGFGSVSAIASAGCGQAFSYSQPTTVESAVARHKTLKNNTLSRPCVSFSPSATSSSPIKVRKGQCDAHDTQISKENRRCLIVAASLERSPRWRCVWSRFLSLHHVCNKFEVGICCIGSHPAVVLHQVWTCTRRNLRFKYSHSRFDNELLGLREVDMCASCNPSNFSGSFRLGSCLGFHGTLTRPET